MVSSRPARPPRRRRGAHHRPQRQCVGAGRAFGVAGGDQAQARRGQGRSADALQDAGRDQQPGIPGQAAGQAGGGKDHQAGLEHALAAEEVTGPGREEQEPAEGDQVAIDHPLLISRGEPESGLHGRQGDVHDRRVDDDHEVGHARDGQDDAGRHVRPGGTCSRGGRRSGGSGVRHDSDSFGTISSVPDLLNKFKLNKFKLIKLAGEPREPG